MILPELSSLIAIPVCPHRQERAAPNPERPGRSRTGARHPIGTADRLLSRSLRPWAIGLILAQAALALCEESDPLRGQRHYEAACAACHGPAGRYDPTLPGVRALEPKPADFTDPLFNSREPSADWFMVTKHGGPAMGFSAAMPAFKDAYADDELEGVIAHLKTLAGEHNYPPGDLNYLRPIRTKKAWLEDELVYLNRFIARDEADDVVYNALEFEKRWFARWQTELKLSHEVEAGHGRWDEVEAGFKYAVHDDLKRTFLLSAGADFAVSLESGNEAEAIPYVAAAKGLGEFFTLQSSVKSHLPFEDVEAGDVEMAAAVHWLPTPWPRGVFPGIELTATAPFDSGDRDMLRWTVIPQLNFGLSRRGHVRAAAGVEIPLNEREYDFRLHFYLLWDFADGMFWQGWTKGRAPSRAGEYE